MLNFDLKRKKKCAQKFYRGMRRVGLASFDSGFSEA